MSRSVDERIVGMRFDNAQFESGVRESLNSINKLKEGLKLKDAAKGFENLDYAAKKFSLAGMAENLDYISSKFTALGIVGVTMFANIANSAINAAKRMVNALTMAPIFSGFQEYETKMNAIQTILTNTKSKGTTLEDVKEVLEDLNKYADKTIYNFAEMTRNLGTFTAAGIELNDAKTAIKGIANLAAGSGATPAKAANAMYQLSQALANGKVMLEDWNSVVNSDMGGELFQNALKKTAKEMGIVVDETKSFRESISGGDSWITAEVLMETLKDFATDPDLLKAATQVRTFTALLDTMKESVQSGWSVSWEHIIGDTEQANKFLTNISNGFNALIGPSVEARNKMLEFWNVNGGRDAIIKALSNAFEGLMSILKPVNQAFREVFPRMTGERLVEISKSIQKLTEHFKIGDKTADRLKATFKGLFSVIDLIFQAIGTVVKGFIELFKLFLPAGTDLLTLTGAIGDYITGIKDSAKESGIFKKVLEEIKELLKPVGDMFSNIGETGSKLGGMFVKIGKALGKGFEKVIKFITDGIGGFNFDTFITIFFGLILTNLLMGIKGLKDGLITGIAGFIAATGGLKDSLVSAIVGMFPDGKATTDNIVSTLRKVRGTLDEYQKTLQADTLTRIAIAIAILAGSLLALSLIDPKRIGSALTAMGGIFVQLMVAMGTLGKLMGLIGLKGMATVWSLIPLLLALSTAMLILSFAISRLAKLDWEQIAKGLTGVAGMMAMLVGAAKFLSLGTKGMIAGATGYIIFAGAILVLAHALEKLSTLSWHNLIKGLSGVGLVMTQLALFMRFGNMGGMIVGSSIGIMILAGALLVLAKAVKSFSELSIHNLVKGLSGVLAALTMIGLFSLAMGSAKHIIATGVALVILSTGLMILSQALKSMATMSYHKIGKAMVVLAGSLTIIAAAMHAMKWGLPGAAAMLVMAGALAILTPVLKIFGGMSIGEIAKSLGLLAGIFVIFYGAVVMLTPVIPVLLAVSAAILMIGTGVALTGAGLLAISAALSTFGMSAVAVAAGLELVLQKLFDLLPYLFTKIGEAVVAFADVIGKSGPALTKAFEALIGGLVDALIFVVPKIINGLGILLDALLEFILKYAPILLDAGIKLLNSLLEGLAQDVDSIVASVVNIVNAFLLALGEELPRIVDAGFTMIISLIDGITQSIEKNMPLIVKSLSVLFGVIGSSIIKAFEDNKDDFSKAGTSVIDDGFLKGMGDRFTAIKGKGKAAGEEAIAGLRSIHKQFEDAGKYLIGGFIGGMNTKIPAVRTKARSVGNAAVEEMRKTLEVRSPSRVFMEIGQYTVEGFVKGLDRFSYLAASSARNMGDNVTSSISGAVGQIASLLAIDTDMSPTIRPVLDLTDVNNGLLSVFNQAQSINVSSINSKTASISQLDAERRATPAAFNMVGPDGVSLIDKMKEFVQNGVESIKSELEVSGMIRVEGVNNQGELTAVMPILARELKIDQGRYSNVASVRRMYR